MLSKTRNGIQFTALVNAAHGIGYTTRSSDGSAWISRLFVRLPDHYHHRDCGHLLVADLGSTYTTCTDRLGHMCGDNHHPVGVVAPLTFSFLFLFFLI